MKKNKDIIGTNREDWKNVDRNLSSFTNINDKIIKDRKDISQGGGPIAIQKQYDKKRMTCRERIKYLLDSSEKLFEIGTFAAYGMYQEYGNIASGGVVTGVGKVKNKGNATIFVILCLYKPFMEFNYFFYTAKAKTCSIFFTH